MYQLLIVDDEASVVESLAETTPWHEIGDITVYKAYSGMEAVQWMEKHTMDIVITDIRMPGMNGLELIELIQSRWKSTKCILLSGHAEFQYAKQAMRNRTADYLLKPASDEEILASVKGVIAELEREWEDISSYQRAVQTLKENLPLLRGNLLHDLLQGRRYSSELLSDKMKMLDIPFNHGEQAAFLLIRLEDQFARYDTPNLALIEYAVGNIAEEMFSPYFDLWQCKDVHDYLVFMLKLRDKPEYSTAGEEDAGLLGKERLLERIAAKLQTNVKAYLKGTISVLVSHWGSFPEQIGAQYPSLVSAMRKRIGSDRELFMTMRDEPEPIEVLALQSLYAPPLLIHLLEAGRWEAVADKLDPIYEELEEKWSESSEHLIEVFHTISAALSHIAHKNGKQLFEIIGGHYNKMLEGNPFREVQQLREWTYSVIELVKESTKQETIDSRISVVKQVQEFVEQQLANDVSLQAIADHIHIHPVYLSKVYKLETGENLSDYLFRLRMEKAVYLLKNDSLKIYEIAERLGYQNTPYFIKIFKKHYGLTPQDYRESDQ